jgi:hypothetical protein
MVLFVQQSLREECVHWYFRELLAHPALLSMGLVGAIWFLGWALFYMARAGLRTLSLPVCWHCGAGKVRRSRSHAGLLISMWFLRPYRCSGCHVRFYAFVTHRRLKPEPEFVANDFSPRAY